MALDDLAPDVDEKELRATGDTVVEEKAEEKDEEKSEVKQETKAETKVEEKTEEKTKFVPHEALHEERMKRKELAAKLEAEAKANADYRADIDAKLAKLFPEKPKPDFEKEPALHLKSEVEETRSSIKPIEDRLNAFEQREAQQRMTQEISTRTQTMETEFVKKNPDYAEAIFHLQKVADANLQAMGVEDPAKRAELVRTQSLGLAHQALQNGKNPAEVAYQLAKNYGFQGGKKQEAERQEEKKIENVRKGQEATSSLGGGGAKSTPITLKDLEQMSDEDLDKLVENDAEWKRLTREMR